MPLRSDAPVPVPRQSWLSGLIVALAPPPGSKPLPVQFQSQRPYLSLCWAACAQMVLHFCNRHVDMCAFAGWRTQRQCCQTDPMQGGCDKTCFPEHAYDALDPPFKYCPAGGRLLEPDLRDELIRCRRPVQMLLEYPGWSHTALIVGTNADGAYLVHDPLDGPFKTYSYELLAEAYGKKHGAWNGSYYAFGVGCGDA